MTEDHKHLCCFLLPFFKKNLLFLAVLDLCCCSQAFSSCSERASHFRGFSSRGALALACVASEVASSGLQSSGSVGEWVKSLSHVWLFATSWTVAYQAPLSMGFSRWEYWSGLPFPSPGDLPNPGLEPRSFALAGRFFTDWAMREAQPPGNSHRFTVSKFVRSPGTTELNPLSPSLKVALKVLARAGVSTESLTVEGAASTFTWFLAGFSSWSGLLGWEPWLDSWLALGCPQLHTNLISPT